jgi:hypothetical protein
MDHFPRPDRWEERGDPPAHDTDRDAARHAPLTLAERKVLAAQRLAEWKRTHCG